ncbi:MAG: exodeoxyribonuclease VII small subunit [Lactobacillales bacterium]|jgi:exodeoxyribonuclease VII small subunit|nr:exodeoxyribonuclease VII small subunit [Lactobacillales bacterium]
MSKEKKPPVQNLTFEEAMGELENVVRMLEGGRIPLDEAVSTYERGVLLKNHCQEKLKEAKLKIDQLIIDKNNAPTGIQEFGE